MEVKDWILLFVPILCNGLLIFILQKIFEKKQIIKNIKNEYLSILRFKIDKTLETYTVAIRSLYEKNFDIETVEIYISNVKDVYYYYIQNKNIFKPLSGNITHIEKLLNESSHDDPIKYKHNLNEIFDFLLKLKEQCIKLKV